MGLNCIKDRKSSLWGKVLLSLCLLAFLPADADAQAKLGLKGGIDISEMSFSEDAFKKSNRTGYYIGPTLKFPVFGLGFDISALYSWRNAEVKGVLMDINDEAQEGKYKFSDKQILVPIHVRYGIDFGEGGIFAFAGPQFGFNIGDKEKSLKDNVAEWRSRDSNLSFDIGGGLTLGRLELTVNYNIPLGRAGEVRLKDATDKVLTKGTYKTWKISAAYYF
ncbi:MAG: outer membrane beta-barrel protein [Prevotella sp.]|nr:outer membrane beta-barrel protein [Prevotella sp.]